MSYISQEMVFQFYIHMCKQYHSDGVKLKHSSEGMVKSAHDFSENGIWALDHYKAASEEFTDPLTPGYKYPRVISY